MFRFWYLICLLFFVININILIDESYDTIYKVINQDQKIQYLSCFNLSEIIINKTKINSNEIKNDFNYGLRWIGKNKKGKFGLIIPNKTIEEIVNQTKSRDYLIYQNRICFIFNDRSGLESFFYLLFFLEIDKNYFAFNNETFSFLEFNYASFSFNQLSIQHKEYPYSGCSKDYSNFKCLNDKIKRIQPLSRYYYRSDDNESIELNYQINQTIIDNEIKIIKQCNQIDCNINLLYLIRLSLSKLEPIILKSFLSISNLDFYFQLIGLIVFFLNIPIYRLIIKIINSISLDQLKRKLLRIKLLRIKLLRIKLLRIKLLRIKLLRIKFKKFKKILNKLNLKLRLNRIKLLKLLIRKYLTINYLILLILLICLAILSSRSIYNFIEERDYPFNKTISVDSIKEELSIIICVSIYSIKGLNFNINNRSLSEIEKETDNFLNIVLKDIYLEFLNKKIPTKWQLESKLIKFRFEYVLERCFQLRIFLDQPKYQTIFSITKLIIEFNEDNKYQSIFILTDNEIFNFNSYRHYYDSSHNFRKRILERSKLKKIEKCKDYNQFDDNCESKSNCIDKCTTKEIYNQIKNLTENLLIDKNHFTDKEWSNLFILAESNDTIKIYSNISKECKDKYSKLDPCVDVRFEYHSEINEKDGIKREIDLNYEVIYYKEDEPSIFKLLLDLLNIESNLFGLNFFSLSLMILGLFRLNLKLIKIIELFIYLLCSICFIFHLWSIYDEIINIEIIFSEHYELINSIESPDLIFCFDFNHTKLINQNYKLTYQYLDKITSDQLREDLIFDRFEYLNGENKWTKLNNETNLQDDNLEIRIFYYLARKCFKIIQKKFEYNRNQFQFIDKTEDGLVLKIFLNRRFLDETIFYFFTKTKNKIRFSKIEELNLKDGYFKLYKIKHELIVRDEFELIKNPLSFLYDDDDDQNDLDKFFTKSINYLDTKLNLVTFKLPINKTELNSNKELDDNLFIQLYSRKKDQTNSNTNHLRKHSHNYVEIYENPSPNSIADLFFSLSFYRKVIVVSNKISLIKLIINLLNVLSFWFDLGILDLHNYFFIFKLLPLQLYKLLIMIKNKLLSSII